MPRSDDTALQQRECGLDRVGMDFAVNIDLGLVFDGLVALRESSSLHSAGIGIEFIGHDHVHIIADILADVLGQRPALGIIRVKEPDISATLPQADNDLLSAFRMPRLVLMALVPTANVSFVHFDRAVKHRFFRRRHCSADAMAEIPRRLVADAECPLDLIGAHPFARLANQIGAEKPLPQRKMGVIEDRASGHAELVAAYVAVILVALRNFRNTSRLAARANWAFGPAEPFQFRAAFFITSELFNEFYEVGIQHG